MECNYCMVCKRTVPVYLIYCSKSCEFAHKNIQKASEINLIHPKRKSMSVLAIPDLHEPFVHENAYDFLRDLAHEWKPDIVVCLGDEADFHACSDYDSDPDGYSAGHEFKAAKKGLKKLMQLFPKLLLCTSNHTARPFRSAFKAGIPKAFFKSYKDAFEAPDGWEWRDEWVIDGVQYIHGEGFSGVNAHRTAAEKHMVSTVMGHIHAHAGVQYIGNKSRQVFGMNCGWLGDEKKYAFRYGKNMPQKPILGAGIIHEGKWASFLPMHG
jgi:hypothetical protein